MSIVMPVIFHHVDFFKLAAQAEEARCKKLLLKDPPGDMLDSWFESLPGGWRAMSHEKVAALATRSVPVCSEDLVPQEVASQAILSFLPSSCSLVHPDLILSRPTQCVHCGALEDTQEKECDTHAETLTFQHLEEPLIDSQEQSFDHEIARLLEQMRQKVVTDAAVEPLLCPSSFDVLKTSDRLEFGSSAPSLKPITFDEEAHVHRHAALRKMHIKLLDYPVLDFVNNPMVLNCNKLIEPPQIFHELSTLHQTAACCCVPESGLFAELNSISAPYTSACTVAEEVEDERLSLGTFQCPYIDKSTPEESSFFSLEEPVYSDSLCLLPMVFGEVSRPLSLHTCSKASTVQSLAEDSFSALIIAKELVLQVSSMTSLPVPLVESRCGLPETPIPNSSFSLILNSNLFQRTMTRRSTEDKNMVDSLPWQYLLPTESCSAHESHDAWKRVEGEAKMTIVPTSGQAAHVALEDSDQPDSPLPEPDDLKLLDPQVDELHMQDPAGTESGLQVPWPDVAVSPPARTAQLCDGGAHLHPVQEAKQSGVLWKKGQLSLKMTDELNFFKSCRKEGVETFRNGDVQAQRDAVASKKCTQPSHATLPLSHELDIPLPLRKFHDVRPAYWQEHVVDLCKREYAGLARTVRSRCPFPLRPFSLAQEDCCLLEEHLESTRDGRERQTDDAPSAAVEATLRLMSLLQQTAQRAWHYGICVAHLALEYCWEKAQGQQHDGSAAPDSSLAQAFLSSSGLFAVRQHLQELYDQVQAGDLEDHPKAPLLASLLTTFHKSPSKPAAKGDAPPPAQHSLVVAEAPACVPLHRLLSARGLRPFVLDLPGSLLVGGRVPAENCSAVCAVAREAVEASSANCLLVAPRYLVPGFPLSLFGLLVCFTDEMAPLPVLQGGETHVLRVREGRQHPPLEEFSLPGPAAPFAAAQPDSGLQDNARPGAALPPCSPSSPGVSPRAWSEEGEGGQLPPLQAEQRAQPDWVPLGWGGAEPGGEEPAGLGHAAGDRVTPAVKVAAAPCGAVKACTFPAPSAAAAATKATAAPPPPTSAPAAPNQSPQQQGERTEPPATLHCVVVNTREEHDPLCMRRRGLYSQLLQLQRRGLQVVERDLLAPADVALGPASCLLLLDEQRLLRSAAEEWAAPPASPTRAARQLEGPLLLQCLATVVETTLKAVSFAYESCVLVFEAPPLLSSRLCDGAASLYAGACALGLQLQCLFSTGPASTERILLALASRALPPPPASAACRPGLPPGAGAAPSAVPPQQQPAAQTNTLLNPQPSAAVETGVAAPLDSSTPPARPALPFLPLPEEESPLEAFLCRFPSLNPLSAHAILRCGLPLPVFLCLPLEHQAALTCPHLPFRALTLFAAQCQSRAGLAAAQPPGALLGDHPQSHLLGEPGPCGTELAPHHHPQEEQQQQRWQQLRAEAEEALLLVRGWAAGASSLLAAQPPLNTAAGGPAWQHQQQAGALQPSLQALCPSPAQDWEAQRQSQQWQQRTTAPPATGGPPWPRRGAPLSRHGCWAPQSGGVSVAEEAFRGRLHGSWEQQECRGAAQNAGNFPCDPSGLEPLVHCTVPAAAVAAPAAFHLPLPGAQPAALSGRAAWQSAERGSACGPWVLGPQEQPQHAAPPLQLEEEQFEGAYGGMTQMGPGSAAGRRTGQNRLSSWGGGPGEQEEEDFEDGWGPDPGFRQEAIRGAYFEAGVAPRQQTQHGLSLSPAAEEELLGFAAGQGANEEHPQLPESVANAESSIGQALAQWWQRRRQKAAPAECPAEAPHALPPSPANRRDERAPSQPWWQQQQHGEEVPGGASVDEEALYCSAGDAAAVPAGRGRAPGGLTGAGEGAGRTDLPSWLLAGLGKRRAAADRESVREHSSAAQKRQRVSSERQASGGTWDGARGVSTQRERGSSCEGNGRQGSAGGGMSRSDPSWDAAVWQGAQAAFSELDGHEAPWAPGQRRASVGEGCSALGRWALGREGAIAPPMGLTKATSSAAGSAGKGGSNLLAKAATRRNEFADFAHSKSAGRAGQRRARGPLAPAQQPRAEAARQQASASVSRGARSSRSSAESGPPRSASSSLRPAGASPGSPASTDTRRLSSYTPVDKRAKEVLSFHKKVGKDKQSKLVWKEDRSIMSSSSVRL